MRKYTFSVIARLRKKSWQSIMLQTERFIFCHCEKSFSFSWQSIILN
ncbi:hypothetical protein [Helicobacter rodentium]|nr:hypothetical protein [Helicobacter rodentium]